MATHSSLRWFATVVVLLAVLVAGAAWIVRRDWERPGSADAERTKIDVDARKLLNASAPSVDCDGCRYRVMERGAGGRWRVLVQRPDWQGCFEIDPQRFAGRPDGGFSGVRRVSCRISAASADGGR